MQSIKQVLAEDMEKYVEIILKEYGDYIPEKTRDYLGNINDYTSKIFVENSDTISMFATEDGIVMPANAYKIFKYLKMIPGYGVNKKHKSYEEGEILNNNTYFDYIKHVFVSGMKVEEFFRDTLLHETMHFCGSDGGNAMREGWTELKTRELAEKYDLKASRCGYPKEVEIASRFQKIVGKDIANQMTFAEDNRQIDQILRESCGEKIAHLYFEISVMMDEELQQKYDHSKFGGLLGPIKKARAYSDIDYSKVYEKLDEFERESKSTKKRNDFVLKIRGADKEKNYKESNIYKDNRAKELDIDR